jgi:D-glycero-D-manno-heptose 1,7-bisphosphate phosphatase
MNPWVVLDRDGVINCERNGCVRSVAEWEALPGSLEAIAALTRAGFKVVVATNQSGIAKGLLTVAELEQIHQKMSDEVERAGGRLQGIFYCPHDSHSGCDCRKPRTGLLDAIEAHLGADLAGAPMVGDSLKDIQAAKAKGCQPVLVRTGKGTQTETTTLLWPHYGVDTRIFDDLAAFADYLIRQH